MSTDTAPDIGNTGTTVNSWGDFLSGIGGVLVDATRWKMADREFYGQDRNIPDYVDWRTGQAYPYGTAPTPPGGASNMWMLAGLMAIGGLAVVLILKAK